LGSSFQIGEGRIEIAGGSQYFTQYCHPDGGRISASSSTINIGYAGLKEVMISIRF